MEAEAADLRTFEVQTMELILLCIRAEWMAKRLTFRNYCKSALSLFTSTLLLFGQEWNYINPFPFMNGIILILSLLAALICDTPYALNVADLDFAPWDLDQIKRVLMQFAAINDAAACGTMTRS